MEVAKVWGNVCLPLIWSKRISKRFFLSRNCACNVRLNWNIRAGFIVHTVKIQVRQLNRKSSRSIKIRRVWLWINYKMQWLTFFVITTNCALVELLI